MALRRVPGVRGYQSDDSGLRELGRSSQTQSAVLAVAQVLAGNAQAVGDGTYTAVPAVVTAGWANERRAGASVRVVDPHWRDSRDAVLLRVADSMKVRNP